MAAVDLAQIETQNADAYDDLIVAVTASKGCLSLFLAVCDDVAFREQLIQRYEAELTAAGIVSSRAQLEPAEPSLRQAVAAAVERSPHLQRGERGVITVLGADALLPLVFGEEARSQQAQFLGYLQWTREAMRAFKQPIILWVSSRLLAAVGRESPDFWSWRKDVFRFQALPKTVSMQPTGSQEFRQLTTEDDDDDELPIAELQKLIAQREQLENPQDDAILATLYFQIGKAYERQSERMGAATHKGSVAEAIAWYDKAAQLQEHQGRDQSALAMTLNNLAELYRAQGKYEQAEPLVLQALEMRRKALGEDHPEVATTLNNLAGLYEAQGKYEQAEPLFLQDLAISRKALGEDHPDVVTTLNNLAGLYEAQGKYEQAEPLFLQALEIWRKALGEDHPDVATTLNNLAGLYRAQGKYEQAEPLYLQALAISRKALGEDHPDVATKLNNLAGLYRAQGKYEQAEPLVLQALAMRRKALGEDHPSVAGTLNNLAELYRAQGQYEQAEPLVLQALAISRKALGEDHPEVAATLNKLALLYRAQGKYEQAEPLFLQDLAISRKALGADHPYVATTLNNLAALYEAQGKYEQAEPLFLQAILIAHQSLGKQHPNTQTILGNFVQCLIGAIQTDRAHLLSDHPLTQSLLQQIRDNEL